MRPALVVVVVLGVAAHVAVPDPAPEPPGVVGVLVSGQGAAPDVATGFIASDRRVVTVAHVLDSGGTVTVRGAGGRRRPARVIRVDRAGDLALLALDAEVPAAGRPALRAPVLREVTARIRDSAGPQLYTRDALELAAHVTAGDSGSPVVAADGRLIGVVFASSSSRPGVAYAVDAAAVERLLAGVISQQ